MLELDLSGLNCPLPILKTKKFLADLATDTLLKVITTDPAAYCDLQDFCRKTGHHLIEQIRENNKTTTIIKRK